MIVMQRLRNLFKSNTGSTSGWFLDWAQGGPATTSGERVSAETALRMTAVWACVRVRSDDVGKLPCHLYKREKDGGKRRAVEHPMYSLIHDSPNPRMTTMEFRQVMQAQVDLRGNAYAVKEFGARGEVVALWPVDPTKVRVLEADGGRELFYRIQPTSGSEITLPGDAVFHLRGMTLDGKVGLSPIAYHRETVGLGLAAEKYGAQFFGNNMQPMGALRVPATLSPEAARELRASWKERHLGKRELAIFDGGMEWVATGLNHEDAQYLDLLNFSNSQVWRLYRMPPHKVQDLTKATFSNIEHQSLDYVTDCLLSELVRWEQMLSLSLLTSDERKDYFFEFLVDGLLRGDQKSRFEAYAIGRNWGIWNVDEIREMENRNHLPDKLGQIYLQPLNMKTVGEEEQPPPPLPMIEPPSDEDDPPPEINAAALAAARHLIARAKLNGHAIGGPNA